MNRHVSRLPRVALALAAAVLWLPSTDDLSGQAPELRRGQTLMGSLAVGDTARYAVTAGDEYWMFGEVDQISVDVVVRIVDEDGDVVAGFDGPGRGSERFSGPVREAGTYSIEVLADDDEAEGQYSITLHTLEAEQEDPRRRTDQLMERWDGEYPGAAVQVWKDGRTLYSKAFGSANLAYGLPFETDTRTNIGSTSKQFTAFAIMLQAERGELSLDDDIREHVPELPEFDEVVTVRHIITHTSGLREFLNLLVMSGRRLDRGDWIDRSEIVDVVKRQPALQNSPGAEWNYNNTAFGLAALIVERTSGQDFHAFMQENVFGPLGMTRTMVRPSIRHIVPDMSEGYTPADDGFLQIGDLGGAVGAGSIYASIEDLQRWVENYANPTIGTREMIDEMMTSYVLTDGEETGYGLGLFIDEQRGLRRIHHGGADVAHRSMLVYYPEINAGVTAQSNHAGFNSGVAFEIAAAFFEEFMEPEEGAGAGSAFDAASYDPESFDEFVGRYSLDPQPTFILTFTREDGTFYTQATGQQQIEIVPTSDSTFSLVGVEASVAFERDEDGEVVGLTLSQGGQTPHATRIQEGEEAEEWEPSVDDLADFVGRFFSEEAEAFFDLSLKDEELVGYQRRLGDAELTPGEEDSFSGGGFTFTFERDRNGEVTGFYLSNGRTRDVRFMRIR